LTEKPGERIGRYRLLQEIGHGGCGVVYMAEQEEPVRRKVALKVIKLGMDTRQVVARFEAERQALALMDHPNIARILDAGITETPHPISDHPLPIEWGEGRGEGSRVLSAGRPYFVMELVGGIKITDYCDRNHLTTRQRLDLFIQVCRAIHHAHQKGIIHRDIKPSNVLVTTQDGVPVPKVIDFGIAKATQGRLTDQTLFTAFEQFIGTPAYMSPEQTQLGSLDVDTRSDIYSLGVLLYELLTGKTPFEAKELMGAGLDEMRRTIREKEPPKPSTRLTQELVAADVRRRTEQSEIRNPKSEMDSASSSPQTKELIHLIRGDLDWIAMKCLEKDRARRYETANGLARDIERHLSNEPVVASPPSRIYRFRKAVRRNKRAFTAAAAVAVLLVTGVVMSTWQAVRATKAKAQALTEKQRADEEAAKQEAINRFLNDMLASADPDALSVRDQTKGPNITMMQVLDAAAREVAAGSLKDRPAIEAAICQTLGRTYLSVGEAKEAERQLRKALELNQRIYGEPSEPTAGSLIDMSAAYGQQGKLEKAEEFARKAIAMERKLHGNEHPDVARALMRLADVLDGRSRGEQDLRTLAATEATYREALALQRKLLPSQSPELIATLTSLAEFVNDFGQKKVEAEAMLREALQIQTSVRGQSHPETARILNALARILADKKDFVEAERLCKQALTIQKDLLGTNNFALRNSYGTLAVVLTQERKFPEAEPAIREILSLNRRAIPGGLDVAYWLKELADNLIAQGRLAEAEIYCREGVQISETSRVGGVGHDN